MLMNYHIGRLVLSSLCVGSFCCGWYLVVFVLQAEACKTMMITMTMVIMVLMMMMIMMMMMIIIIIIIIIITIEGKVTYL